MCPNHHVLFDQGAFAVTDGMQLIGTDGKLGTAKGHQVEAGFLAYHRDHIYKPSDG